MKIHLFPRSFLKLNQILLMIKIKLPVNLLTNTTFQTCGL